MSDFTRQAFLDNLKNTNFYATIIIKCDNDIINYTKIEIGIYLESESEKKFHRNFIS